jgi:hypothetical protein
MTTSLRIRGIEYDLEEAFSNTPLNILVYMTKRVGVTMKAIVGGLQAMNEHMGEDGNELAALMEVFSDEESLDTFRGLIWLVKTQAGERADGNQFLTLDQAADGIGFRDLEFVNEPGPTELGAVSDRSSSTTSSSTSLNTSSSSPTSGLVTTS